MNGDIWRTKAGRTGAEVNRHGGEAESVELLFPPAENATYWRSDVEVYPLSELTLVPNCEARYGGADGGRG
jgi:hypothetical protein